MKKETDILILIANYGRSEQDWLTYMLRSLRCVHHE